MPVSRIAWPSKWLRVRYGIAIACSTTSSFWSHSSLNGASPGARPKTSFNMTRSDSSYASVPLSG